MASEKHVLGMDFGTDSVRIVVVNAATGKRKTNDVVYYPRWSQGKYCDPAKNQFRQHPLDYIESMEQAVKAALLNFRQRPCRISWASELTRPGPLRAPLMKKALRWR